MSDSRQGVSPPRMDDDIAILTPAEVEELRVPWDARYSKHEIRELVAAEPGVSVWSRRTGGYLLGSKWRHRDEIANVVDIVGPSVADELLRAFVARCSQLGFSLAVVAEYAERRRSSFYVAAGMDIIEEIVVYELGRIPAEYSNPLNLAGFASSLIDVGDDVALRELVEMDHAAFPWLWWNSAGEFRNYAEVPGVVIEGFRDSQGDLVGYIGVTSLGSWGHLDRIAISPHHQGRGLGRKLLTYAIIRLRAGGAKRVALSTQASNHVSRALYESVGFRRSRSHDYRIYGRSLRGSEVPSSLENAVDE